jgi:hypothetical protein
MLCALESSEQTAATAAAAGEEKSAVAKKEGITHPVQLCSRCCRYFILVLEKE